MKSWLVILFAFSLVTQAGCVEPVAKLSVRVIDDNKQPLEDVNVGIGFRHSGTPSAYDPYGTETYSTFNGKSDRDGIFTAQSMCNSFLGMSAEKEGYYKSSKEYAFIKWGLGKYEPWNPTIDIVLRKIINPVPTYGRGFMTEIPTNNEAVGFDLLIGDWVKPYGKGEVKDMLFTLKRDDFKDDSNYNTSLEISMPRQGDGFAPIKPETIIQESEFTYPYEAPTEGYSPTLSISFSASMVTPNSDGFVGGCRRLSKPDGKDFFIRIRSEVDGNGNVVKAIYGRIFGLPEYYVTFTKTAKLSFGYDLNLDNTRNVEFDQKKNIFKKK